MAKASAKRRPPGRRGAARATAAARAAPAPKRTQKGKNSSRTRRHLKGVALASYADVVWERLHALYPDAHCELDFRSPWELLVATILSAQCTDKRVNMVTPTLFARYPGPSEMAARRGLMRAASARPSGSSGVRPAQLVRRGR